MVETFTSASQAARASRLWRELITATKEHADARQAADPEGRYGSWFGRGEFRHFEAQLHGKPIIRPYESTRTYWVASTQFTHSDGTQDARQYKVHVRDDETGSIDTVSEEPHYSTAEAALAAMRFIALGVNK